MQTHINTWYSPRTKQQMPIVTYGWSGFSLLMIPTATADYLEYERFGLIETLTPFIEEGILKIYSINSLNNQSWMNHTMLPEHKAINHNHFNSYVINEVLPYIHHHSGPTTKLYTAGASLGAFHAANLFFKYPHAINGCIAMSGDYDLTSYTQGFWDNEVYFNSPVHYLPLLTDEYYLSNIRSSNHIHFYTGSGQHELPAATDKIKNILLNKQIPVDAAIWGQDMHHDWPTWKRMLPHIIATQFL